MPRVKFEPKSEQKLFEASGHLAYEMNLFNYCVYRLTLDWDIGHDPNLHNVIMSAFPIHARNIIDFLYGEMDIKGTMPGDDICAFQFFDDLNFWHTKRPSKTQFLTDIKPDIDKRAAHLSYWRVDNPGYWWKWVDVHLDLKPVLTRFVELVPYNRIDPAVINFRSQWAWSDNLPPRP